MKAHELLFVLSVLIIILSVGFYLLSINTVWRSDEDRVSNLFGKNFEVDSTLAVETAMINLQEEQRHRFKKLLWGGIIVAMVLFGGAIFIKRKKYGPDLFLDNEDETE